MLLEGIPHLQRLFPGLVYMVHLGECYQVHGSQLTNVRSVSVEVVDAGAAPEARSSSFYPIEALFRKPLHHIVVSLRFYSR